MHVNEAGAELSYGKVVETKVFEHWEGRIAIPKIIYLAQSELYCSHTYRIILCTVST